jgi:hypothetical protein
VGGIVAAATLALGAIMPATASAAPVIQNLGQAKYGGTTVGHFTLDGQTAFCMEHAKATPGTGAAYDDGTPYDDARIRAVLYYGWGGKGNIFGGDEQRGIVATSLALSHFYSGQPAKETSTTIGGYNELINYGKQGMASNSIYLNGTTDTVEAKTHFDGGEVQTSDSMKLDAEANNSITFAPAAGMKFVNESTGASVDTNGSTSVTVNGGQSFHFTASPEANVDYGSGKLSGSMGAFSPILFKPANPGQQTIVRGSITDPTASVSFHVKFTPQVFQPSVKSDQSDHRIENGQFPSDTIVSGVTSDSPVKWWGNTKVSFDGQLFWTATKPAESDQVPAGAELVGTATASFDGPDQKATIDEAQFTMDSAFSAKHKNANPSKLPNGYAVWVWSTTKSKQSDATKPRIWHETWTDGTKNAETAQSVRNMKPTVASSVSKAYEGDDTKVTGEDGKDRPAVQNAEGMIHIEKTADLKDTVTIGVKDSNNDGKVDTQDWIHTNQGWGEGKESEDNQLALTVKGEYIAAASREDALKYMAQTKSGKKITDLPAGMKVVATTEFTTNKAGTFTVSGKDGADAKWTPADGQTMDNLPSGYGTFRYQILNKDQDTKGQTGIESSDDYPFAEEADDGYFSADEVLDIRLKPVLDSAVSNKTLKSGETTTDKLMITRGNGLDQWPTYPESDVTEGEDASEDPVALDFHGSLYYVGGDEITTSTNVPEKYADKIVHEADIKGVTDFGSYTTDSFTLTDSGRYVWYWTMKPALKGSAKLQDLAWREVTHAKVNHDFGMASETVQVGELPKEEQPITGCKVTTNVSAQSVIEGETFHDTATVECKKGTPVSELVTSVDFPYYKQDKGTDPAKDVLVKTLDKVSIDANQWKLEGGKLAQDQSVTVNSADTTAQPGTYYFRERAYTTPDTPPTPGQPREPHETIIVKKVECEISTKSQGKVTLKDGHADLYDTATINCQKAATIAYQLWKQSNGDDITKDVLITTTGTVDINGRHEVKSPKVTVTETGTYYWREVVYGTPENPGDNTPCVPGDNTPDKPCNPVLEYGKPRLPNESVDVVPEGTLAHTGSDLSVVVLATLLAGAMGIGATELVRRRSMKEAAHRI